MIFDQCRGLLGAWSAAGSVAGATAAGGGDGVVVMSDLLAACCNTGTTINNMRVEHTDLHVILGLGVQRLQQFGLLLVSDVRLLYGPVPVPVPVRYVSGVSSTTSVRAYVCA